MPETTHDTHVAIAAFDGNADSWEEYTTTPLGQLRQELTLRHLARHLEALPRGLKVLDAGGGTGSHALPLAQQGHQVCLLDFSSQMLSIARERARRLHPALLERIDFCCAPVEDIPRLLASEPFDLVLCHTLLEYVPQPGETIRTLNRVLRPGGLMSILVVSPYADALRWALAREDLEKARLALCEGTSVADHFGLPRRTFEPEMIREVIAQERMEVVAEYGIRVFADYLPAGRLSDPDFFSRLLELEMAAGSLHPYSLIGRYTLIVASKVGAA